MDASKLQAPTSSTLIAQGNFDSADAHNRYFYSPSDAPDEMVFVADGASSRSELRQMSEWYSGDAGNTMSGSFHLVDPLAQTVDQLTVMQVHTTDEPKKPLVRIAWMREKNGLSDHFWAVVKDDLIEAGEYSWIPMGQRNSNGNSVSIDVAANRLTIAMDGQDYVTDRALDYWASNSNYFKAGVYLQTDGHAEVHFTELDYQRTPALNAALPPSGNFNLDNWKITLPYSKDEFFGSGGSSAAEVKPFDLNPDGVAPLNDGFTESGSFVTAADGAMRFMVDLADPRVASTTNSSYARSELRELYDWSPGESDSQANWSPAGRHLLNARVSVTEYFADDPQTVVGQIHAKDSSKALVKLQWDGPAKPVRAIINAHPVEGNPFNLTFSDYGNPGTQPFDYSIVLEDETITVTVGNESKSVVFGEGNMSTLWSDHVYYFKAGNYAQASIGSAGRFVVNIYQLSVEHQ
ncbi:polysaccharide lyase family 7 protein [Simiduia agarivorans]|uniref:polysaccharide lyase family 7 protein n=1 Tax=Simiduia agarivorans TaxID=447471 RepID=UPI00028B6221|nr:polysaccharide lyase family 7 protein [Simiduia agarivorans]